MHELALHVGHPLREVSPGEHDYSNERVLPVKFHFIRGTRDDFIETGLITVEFIPGRTTWHDFHYYHDYAERFAKGDATVRSIEKVGRSGFLQARGLVVQPKERVFPNHYQDIREEYQYEPSADPSVEYIFPLEAGAEAPEVIRKWRGSEIIGLLEPNPDGEVTVGILPGLKKDTRKVIVRLAPQITLVSPDVFLPFGIRIKDKGKIIPVSY